MKHQDSPPAHPRTATIRGTELGTFIGSVADLVTLPPLGRFGWVCGSEGWREVLPHLADVVVESVRRDAGVVMLRTRSRTGSARCPRCGRPSGRMHGRYERRLREAPLDGLPVVIVVLIRRFKCLAAECPTVTFAEQIPGLTRPHTRHTPALRDLLGRVAQALGSVLAIMSEAR
ncbi:transposase family protein [Streptomyces narbonensis]|uniref:Transposase family protein n=1 Tax=Streptomyces narbonensis TaxID=67333 RepID=A0ABV3CC29_9ACTN